MIFLRKIGGRCPPVPPEVFQTKRIRGALTLTPYSHLAVQAEAPMTAPEEGVPSPVLEAERSYSFGLKYRGEREGLAPRSALAAGAYHA